MNECQEEIKKFIISKLSEQEKILLEDIKNKISDVKKIMQSEMKNYVFPVCDELTEEQYEELRKILEVHFQITADCGILLSDNDDNRDNNWWTSKEKQISDKYYWDRYKKYIEKRLPKEVIRALDTDTDVIMNNIEDPKNSNIQNFSRYGMVVGYVQSGKTGNYSGLICKAADAGYKFIVVIAGGLNNLRNQTQERLNEYFVGSDGIKKLEIANISGVDNSKQPISLTTSTEDFNSRDANKATITFDNITVPIILVIKKNVSTLKNVVKWIKSHNSNDKVKKHAMLVIDDESDYASVNYKDEEDPTQINKQIRNLISLFGKSSYVAYTATPFANIFIDHKIDTEELGSDLFPRNFIYALEAPSNYMGAKSYFIPNENNLDAENQHVIEIEDYKECFPFIQTSGYQVKYLPESLKGAVKLFLINISIRNLKGQGNQHNSMLIHVSRFTGVHKQVFFLVNEYLEEIKNILESFGKLPSPEKESLEILDFKKVYTNMCNNKEFSFEKIIENLTDLIKIVLVREVHRETKIPLEYRKDSSTNVIAVGGTSLSRGYTLEGLSVTYFTRNSMFYDTLMQMGRWFGYREGYRDLCKVFIPKPISDNFIKIINATDDLMNSLDYMRKMRKTPKEFGLGVQYHPSTRLQITAKNKMKSSGEIPIRLDLQGTLKENALIPKSKKDREENLNSIRLLVRKIEEKNYEKINVGTDYLWKDVDSNLVLEFFKEVQKTAKYDQYGIGIGFPMNFIIKRLENLNSPIDIAFFSKKENNISMSNNLNIGCQIRKATIIDNDHYLINKHKISSSNPEKIILEKGIPNDLTSKEIREKYMTKPLLMLHLLQLYIGDKKEKPSEIEEIEGFFGAYGISFPLLGDKEEINESTTTLKVNSVYLENLKRENEIDCDEEYGDDYGD